MNVKRFYILAGVIIVFAAIVCSIFSVFKNVKVDDFKPAFVAFLIDSSSANTKLEVQKKFVKQFCSTLDPDDKVKILQVSGDSYLIYEGSPQNLSGIKKSLDVHTKDIKNSSGIAYDMAIKKAVQHCLVMKKNGYIPSIVVIGDIEKDGKPLIDWTTLPSNLKRTLKFMPDLSMAFLWVEPKGLDTAKLKLTPVFGENQLIVSTELTVDKSSRKILKALGR